MKQDYDVEVTWEPFDLHPEVPPDGMPTPQWILEKWDQTGNHLRRMADEAGLPMVQPEWQPNTRRAHEATEYARAHGRLAEFHRRVFDKFYGEGRDIGSWDALREAAADAGLDPDDMQRAVEAGEYRAILDEKFQFAHEIGVTGVPLYVFDDRYAISGAQPYEMFRRFMEQYLSGGLKQGG